VTAEALREDAGGFYRRGVVQILDPLERAQRKPPRPSRAPRVMLWVTDDLDNGEDRLPDRCITDREVAALDRRPSG
jgi:hypothetical protein